MAIPLHVRAQVAAHRALRPNRDRRGRLVRGHGMRSRIPKQERPLHVEAGYATAISAAIDVRDVLHPLLTELPDLLKTARASRADEADYPAPIEHDVAGLRVMVENPAGTVRSWTDADGTQGSTLMRWDYGFLDGYLGADGEDVDVYRGPNPDPHVVHVVHQMSKAGGFKSYDEDKVMLGWDSPDEAAAAYLAQYDDPRFFGSMSSYPMGEFLSRLGASAGKPIAREVHRADAGESGRVRAMIDRARKALGDRMNTKALEELARRYGESTSNFQRAQLARQVKAAIGVDLVGGDRRVPAIMDHFVGENVSLIRSLGNRTLDDVEKIVTRAFTSGDRADDVADDIQDRYGVSDRHAQLIARDQIGKLNGQVNASRQQDLGINKFTWRTVGDERVRDEHRELNNQVFSYDDLPDEGLPGEPINCRCSAEPYFDDMLDELAGDGREASSTGEDGGADDESGDELDRQDAADRFSRADDFNEDQPRDDHGRFAGNGGGGGGNSEHDAQLEARAVAPKPGESPEQHARRLAINAASRTSKANARAAARSAAAAAAGQIPAPAPAPVAPSQPTAPATKAIATAPKPGESPEQHAARLARNEASRVQKAAARSAARAAAQAASQAPAAAPPPPPTQAPPVAAPIAPAAPQATTGASAPKPGETPAQHAARLARNAASAASKARARAAAIAARGHQTPAQAPPAPPSSNQQQPAPSPPSAPAPSSFVESAHGYKVNAGVPEQGPALERAQAAKLAAAYEKASAMPVGARSAKLSPKQQLAVRSHLHDVLAPYNLAQGDKLVGSGARLSVRPLRGARGTHDSTGIISINTPVARNAAQFAIDQKNGVDYRSTIKAAGGAKGVEGWSPSTSAAENMAIRANDYRTHVHEALHGYGPRPQFSRSYAREGVIAEEVSTEVSARKIVRDQLKLDHGDVRALSRPEHSSDQGSYVREIYSTTRAVADAVHETTGRSISHAEAYHVLERASLRYKSMPTHPDASTPHGSVKMFSSSIDFEHLEKVTGTKLTSDHRAKVADKLAEKITAVGQGRMIY